MQLIRVGSLFRVLLPLLVVFALCSGSTGSRASTGDHELQAVELEASACTSKGVELDQVALLPGAPVLEVAVSPGQPRCWVAVPATPAPNTLYSIRAPPVAA